MKYRIGIDIGGTHTDGVVVDNNNKIVAKAKTLTTQRVDEGFKLLLKQLLDEVKPDDINDISLGTTHATNAILERKDLYRVGVIRVAGHGPQSIPPCFGWPADLASIVLAGTEFVSGGYECDGSPITPFKHADVVYALEKLAAQGAESLAIVGVFSPQNPQQELEVKTIAAETLGSDFPVSLSHQIGGIGYIERENSTILNACLKSIMKNGFYKLRGAIETLGIQCPLWITQNNGSRMPLQQAADYPVLTISAGPTNSFIGGSKLAGLDNAVVVDIGGTSTDVGVVRSGYPRRRLNKSKIGGISLNFSMPDVLSIALGGGSHVDLSRNTIGPLSCGKDTFHLGKSFGGSQLTLTDIALSAGHISVPGAKPPQISERDYRSVMNKAKVDVQQLVRSIGIEEQRLPVVMIGGGASLFDYRDWEGNVFSPQHANVANAFGAALAEFSATIDLVVPFMDRDKEIAKLEEIAIEKALAQGADKRSVRIVDRQIIPYHYATQPIARVMITASG